jgi:hypothetical protein
LRDGSIPLRFQGVSQLSCVQTKSKKKLRQFLCLLKIKELLAQFLDRGGCAINKKIPFLSGADGVVGKFQQNKVRLADMIRRLRELLLTTTNASPYRARASRPSAPQRNGTFLLRRSHPYQETAPVTPLSSVGIKLAQFLFAFGLDAGQLGTP